MPEIKKRIFIAAIIILCPINVFSNIFSGCRHDAEFGFGVSESKGIEGQYAPVNLTWSFCERSGKYGSLLSVQFADKTFDFTTATEFYFQSLEWKFDWTKINIGAGALYHFQNFYSLHHEHDGYVDSIFKLKFKGFTFKNRIGYGFKSAKILALDQMDGFLWDETFSITANLSYEFKNGFEIHHEAASHDLYRYPLFISPHWTFGVTKIFNDDFKITLDFISRFRDQFTTAPYLDYSAFAVKLRYTLKK